MKSRQLQITSWAISLILVGLATTAWGQGHNWQRSGLGTYDWFPLFGLLAFSLMLSHYIAADLRLYFKQDKAVLKSYFELTSLAVLVAILLHPGLLEWQLWRDGLGLPPGSTKLYIGSALYIWTWVGITAWVAFMAYELRRWFSKKPWWKYVAIASDTAMLLIFFHALKLGNQLQSGWFQKVWYLYGVVLIGSLAYIYTQKTRSTKTQ